MTLIEGSPNNDNLTGTSDDDTILGLEGNDVLNGSAGKDTLTGGPGRDILIGGTDSDTFVLSTDSAATDLSEADIILAFQPNFFDPSTPIDAIALTGGLTEADLILEVGNNPEIGNLKLFGNSTIIRVAESNRILGIVTNITPERLSGNFVSLDGSSVSDSLEFAGGEFSGIENGIPILPVTVTRTGENLGEASVTVTLSDGTATASEDYDDTALAINFSEGETEKTVPIPILDDSLPEGDESVILTLSDPTGDLEIGDRNTATFTILDDEVSGAIAFASPEFTTVETDFPLLDVTVIRTGGTQGEISATINLSDGTATAAEDYETTPITVNFADGEIEKNISLPILGDDLSEGLETINLTLENPTGGATIGTQNTAILQIIDDEAGSILSSNNSGNSLLFPDTIDVFLPPGEELTLEFTIAVPGESPSETSLAPSTFSTRANTLNQEQAGLEIPLDVLLLQDLSGSFEDDLPVVQELVPDLVSGLQSFQPDTQFGVASFIDQPVPPFGVEGDYVYRLELGLTSSETDFQEIVNNLVVGDGEDIPEAQLSALLETAVSTETIGFRDGARRVAVVATDAPFHEGDFYPTVEEVRTALIENDILPIFVVTSDEIDTYEDVVDVFEFGSVVELESDSSNLVDAITEGLAELGSEINIFAIGDDFNQIEDIFPGSFEGVTAGEELTFFVTLENDGTGADDSITIRALGFGETTINVFTGLLEEPFGPPITQEPEEYLDPDILLFQDVVTGGDEGGRLLNERVENNPSQRTVGFRELNNPIGAEQTWVVLHGWKDDTDPDPDGFDDDADGKIFDVAQAISLNNPGDRVLLLDWREAAYNTDPIPLIGDLTGGLLTGGNGRAATWIGAVAEYAVTTLANAYGISSLEAQQSLNLVGHSLGSLLGAEIGRIYRDGNTLEGSSVVPGNGEGVRTITALDPPSDLNLNLLLSEYDIEGRVGGTQSPEPFADASVFSRAFVGERSSAGNPELAVTADEAFQMDFSALDPLPDLGSEHTRVVVTFTNLVDGPGLIGDLLGVDAYQNINELPINDFDELRIRRVGDRGYQGIIDVDENNRPTLLIAKANTGEDDNIVIGGLESDELNGTNIFTDLPGPIPGGLGTGDDRYRGAGDDRLFGDPGNDTLVGNGGNDTLLGGAGSDRLIGDGGIEFFLGFGDDILYGGADGDELIGGSGSDLFVIAGNDGGIDTIEDFELGIDRIGLIDLTFGELSFQQDAANAAIIANGNFLAAIENVGVAQLQNPGFFVPISTDSFAIT